MARKIAKIAKILQTFIFFQNGTVWVNYRIRVKAPCNLDLRLFPFDVQQCELVFESYSYNAEEVKLRWFPDHSVTFMNPTNLPDFDLSDFTTDNSTLEYPNGFWDRLRVTFKFKRRYGFYVFQAYIPTYITVMVSWVSFFMDPKALPARTTVGVSSLLALTFQFGNILKNLPPVSYTKAMDVWMLGNLHLFVLKKFSVQSNVSYYIGCISFVFGSMVELAMVCTFAQSAVRTESVSGEISRRQSVIKSLKKAASIDSDKIDKASMFLFPMSFALFNVLYWWYYVISAVER